MLVFRQKIALNESSSNENYLKIKDDVVIAIKTSEGSLFRAEYGFVKQMGLARDLIHVAKRARKFKEVIELSRAIESGLYKVLKWCDMNKGKVSLLI